MSSNIFYLSGMRMSSSAARFRIAECGLFALLFVLIFSGCSQINARKAVSVNDAVIAEHRELMAALEQFVHALETKDSAQIYGSLAGLRNTAGDGLAAVSQQNRPECDPEFIDAAVSLFRFYGTISREDYRSIAQYYTRDSLTYSEYDSLQTLIRKTEAAQEDADDAFIGAQEAFARDCGFKLVRHVD